eukprot:TRINITY_DN13628_c0_g1_i1.p1 TRINITY_DN13628_c0_g1~~TRINITY_DN13628_c0_g1_i1.p1  ORF type:complete len:195 (+),score=32.67 TRINITY_DN13628_c0_g1_i1:60-587(+)
MKKELLRKAGIGFSIGCFGDIGAQLVQSHHGVRKEWDCRRTVLWGSAVAALQVPLFHVWFKFLEGKNLGTGATGGLVKTLLESLTVGPLYLILINLWSTFVIKRGSPAEALTNLTERFPTSIKAAWCVVAPVQLISHTFLPVQYKLLFLNVVSALWNIILSEMLCREETCEEKKT